MREHSLYLFLSKEKPGLNFNQRKDRSRFNLVITIYGFPKIRKKNKLPSKLEPVLYKREQRNQSLCAQRGVEAGGEATSSKDRVCNKIFIARRR
jgi:hypothetical protein